LILYGSYSVPFAGLNSAGKPMAFGIGGGHAACIFTNVGGMADDRSVRNMTPGRLPPIYRTLTLTGDVTSGSNMVTNISSTANIYVQAVLNPVEGVAGARAVTAVTADTITFSGVAATATSTGITLSNTEWDCEGDWPRGHTYHDGNVCSVKMEDGTSAKCLFYFPAAPWAGVVNARGGPVLFNLDTKSYIERDDPNNAEAMPGFGRGTVVEDPNGTLLHVLCTAGIYATFDGAKKASEGRMKVIARFAGGGDDYSGNAYAAGSCFADGAVSLLFCGGTPNGTLRRFRIDTFTVTEITITPTDGDAIPTLTNSRYGALERNPRNPNQFFYSIGRDGYYTLNLINGTFSSTHTKIPVRTGENADMFPTRVCNDGSQSYTLAKALDVPGGGLILLHAPLSNIVGTFSFTKLAA
jgi:hypothetical protein